MLVPLNQVEEQTLLGSALSDTDHGDGARISEWLTHNGYAIVSTSPHRPHRPEDGCPFCRQH